MRMKSYGVQSSIWFGVCALALTLGAGAALAAPATDGAGHQNRVTLKEPSAIPGLADTNFALEPPALAQPDALLALDLNRSAVINKIISKFETEQSAEQLKALKTKLFELRADQLLAASLAGSMSAVVDIVAAGNEAAKGRMVATAAAGGERSKVFGDASTELVYTPLTPCRLIDTRGFPSALGAGGGFFAPNTRRTISPGGGCAIPTSNVKALVLGFTTQNLTPSSGGYLAIVAPAATISATVDVFNFGAEWSASNIITPTSSAGQFDVFVSTAQAHFIADVVGYFSAPTGLAASFVQNTTTLQPSSNFNISGTGLIGGNLGVGTVTPGYKLDVLHGGGGGLRVKSSAGFSALDIDASTGDAALRFQRAGVNQWNIRNNPANDNLQVFELGATERLRIENSTGNVVIGNSAALARAKLEINGAGGTFTYGQRGVLTSTGATTIAGAGTETNASLYATNNLWASGLLAFSDARIKRIKGRSDSARDLTTLAAIEVTDYTYVDYLSKGTGKQKKVIAQQVEKVYPQAVRSTTDVVPDIYKNAAVKDGWVTLATNLKKGDRVRLIGNKVEGVHEVLEVAKGKFRTDFVADGEALFVYGREVKDFRAVDYEAIAMLNVSATQELNRRVEKQAAEIAMLKQQLAQVGELQIQAAQLKEALERLGAIPGTLKLAAK